MSQLFTRTIPLRQRPGPRTDILLRAVGLFGLLPVGALVRVLYGWRHAGAKPAQSPMEFVVALVAVMILWGALTLLLAGDNLVRAMPRPPRPLQ